LGRRIINVRKGIMKKWLGGILGVIIGGLAIAWVTGAWNPIIAIRNIILGGSQNSEQFAEARDLARKYYFFSTGNDSWSNPRTSGFPNKFHVSGAVIYDEGTGLTWQQGGSSSSIGHPEISAYLRKLNQEKLNGYDDWRLPSLAEAWTLLEYEQTQEGLHIDPAFEQKQTWIWTSTMTDDGYGWFITFEYGRPVFQNAWQSHAYVRAVRGPEFK
jgi:hypothetical protein